MGILQNLQNCAQRAMLVLVFRFYAHARSGHAVLPDLFGGQFPSGHRQAAQFLSELRDVAASVEERAESHVPADARETIKIREFHGTPPRGSLRAAGKVSVGSISILSAAVWGVKSRIATPPPPHLPGSAESKGLTGPCDWICTF